MGVARQYCGQLGKQDNCQVAVSLSLANRHASLPVAWQLYLPQEWADDPARRRKAGVPEGLVFKTKPEIALSNCVSPARPGCPGVALLDAGYGNNSALRADITALGLTYAAGILSTTRMGARRAAVAGEAVVGSRTPAETDAARRQAPTSHGQGARARPAEAGLAHDCMARWRSRTAALALCTPAGSRRASRRMARRAASGGMAADRVAKRRKRATKYWLSTLPQNIAFADLVDFAKLRWRIERDYQELKQEVGLGHFEGRGWRGFHHHATMCIAAYGFLIAERATIPAQQTVLRGCQRPVVPNGYRRRGAAAASERHVQN